MKKLVFSKAKWKADMKRQNQPWQSFKWVNKCEGLTEDEMKKINMATCPQWMVEVDA